jgi:hypothetical protein
MDPEEGDNRRRKSRQGDGLLRRPGNPTAAGSFQLPTRQGSEAMYYGIGGLILLIIILIILFR